MTDQFQQSHTQTADNEDGRRTTTVPAPEAPAGVRKPAAAAAGRSVEGAMALLDNTEAGGFRSRWALIQASFVDEPRSAVEQGDALVAELMQRLAEVFAAERANLEAQWSTGSDVSTEDLRLALRRYRSFFDRLLSL
jgi:hypothetical protein